MPLSWVPEDCGGSGASLAEGFGVVGAAGRFAIAVPLVALYEGAIIAVSIVEKKAAAQKAAAAPPSSSASPAE